MFHAPRRRGEAVSQAGLVGRLDVTQGAISKLENSDDVRVSTLRRYLEALGARLELVAVFDDDDRRVPVHLRAAAGRVAQTIDGAQVKFVLLRTDEGWARWVLNGSRSHRSTV